MLMLTDGLDWWTRRFQRRADADADAAAPATPTAAPATDRARDAHPARAEREHAEHDDATRSRRFARRELQER